MVILRFGVVCLLLFAGPSLASNGPVARSGPFVATKVDISHPGSGSAGVLVGDGVYGPGMSEHWLGLDLGLSGGKNKYGYAMADFGTIGIVSAHLGAGYYSGELAGHDGASRGLVGEIGIGMMAGFGFLRYLVDADTKVVTGEFGIQAILPVHEGGSE